VTKYTDNLWHDLAREHGAALAYAGHPEPGRARRLSPRVLAGSTLALAGVGAAVTLGLTATGSTSAGGTRVVTDAYTITESSSGSVLVTISRSQSIVQANQKLADMGIGERVIIHTGPGAAPVSGPVACAAAPGVSGPPVKVLLGTNGTELIQPGTTGQNTGVGSWHLASCQLTGDTGSGGAGNTGAG
jgi:hypothetical protein